MSYAEIGGIVMKKKAYIRIMQVKDHATWGIFKNHQQQYQKLVGQGTIKTLVVANNFDADPKILKRSSPSPMMHMIITWMLTVSKFTCPQIDPDRISFLLEGSAE